MTAALWAAAATGAATLTLAALGASYLWWVWRHRADYPDRSGRTK